MRWMGMVMACAACSNTQPPDFRPMGSSVIRGTVRTQAGSPVANATVTAMTAGGGCLFSTFDQASSDAEGRYSLRILELYPAARVTARSGHLHRSVRWRPPQETIDFVIDGPDPEAELRMSGPSEMSVSVTGCEHPLVTGTEEPAIRSDAGTLLLFGLPDDRSFELEVFCPGDHLFTEWHLMSPPLPSATTITMARQVPVTLELTDEQNRPLAGLELGLIAHSSDGTRRQNGLLTTDEKGSAVVDLAEGSNELKLWTVEKGGGLTVAHRRWLGEPLLRFTHPRPAPAAALSP